MSTFVFAAGLPLAAPATSSSPRKCSGCRCLRPAGDFHGKVHGRVYRCCFRCQSLGHRWQSRLCPHPTPFAPREPPPCKRLRTTRPTPHRHRQLLDDYLAAAETDAQLCSRVRCLRSLAALHNLQLGDLCSGSMARSWTDTHGGDLPALLRTAQAWPRCPTVHDLRQLLERPVSQKNSVFSDAVLSNNNNDSLPGDTLSPSQLLSMYDQPTPFSHWALSLGMAALLSSDDLPSEAVQALSPRLPYPYRFWYDFNLTPKHSLVGIHDDGGLSVLASVVGDGAKLFLLWPRTEHNKRVFQKCGDEAHNLLSHGPDMEDPLMTIVDNEHSIYIPAGVFHAVLTLESCMLPVINFVNPTAILTIGECIRTSAAFGTQGLGKAREYADVFASAAAIILDNDITGLAKALAVTWHATRATLDHITTATSKRRKRVWDDGGLRARLVRHERLCLEGGNVTAASENEACKNGAWKNEACD